MTSSKNAFKISRLYLLFLFLVGISVLSTAQNNSLTTDFKVYLQANVDQDMDKMTSMIASEYFEKIGTSKEKYSKNLKEAVFYYNELMRFQSTDLEIIKTGTVIQTTNAFYTTITYSLIENFREIPDNPYKVQSALTINELWNFATKMYDPKNVTFDSTSQSIRVYRESDVIARSANGHSKWTFIPVDTREFSTLKEFLPEALFDELGYVDEVGFYQIKNQKVSYHGKELEGCDAATFRRIGSFHWADNKFVYWGGKKLPEADVETFTTDLGAARDKNHVYSRDKIVVGADPIKDGLEKDKRSRTKPRFNYLRDSQFIYFNRIKLEGADFKTFEILLYQDTIGQYNCWGKDKNRVYHNSYVVAGADPKTITILNRNQAKDKNDEYFILNRNRIKIDPETFEILSDHMIKSKTGVYYGDGKLLKEADPATFDYLNGFYHKDKNSVFYQQKIIESADVNSFQISENRYYAHDQDRIFYKGKPLKEVDRTSWVLLSEKYSKDENQVYYIGIALKEVDAETFEVITIDGRKYGQDKFGKLRANYRLK